MGARGNVCIIDGGVQLLTSRTLGYSLLSLLLDGPAKTDLLRDQMDTLDNPTMTNWTDDVWAEAGAVIDRDHHILTLFTWYAEDEFGSLDALIAALADMWTGWQVLWAYEGQRDLARAAGVLAPGAAFPPSMSRAATPGLYGPGRAPFGYSLDELDGEEPLPLLVSVSGGADSEGDESDRGASRIDGNGVQWHAVFDEFGDVFACGPGLVDGIDPVALVDGQPLAIGLPASGAHLDVAHHRAFVWTASVLPGIAETFRAHWPGWTLVFLHGRWEVHRDLTGSWPRFRA